MTSYTPAFIYYYACGSKLLTLYIPVYIYSYTILFVSVPLLLCLQAKVKRRWLPQRLRYYMIKGVLRPAATYRDENEGDDEGEEEEKQDLLDKKESRTNSKNQNQNKKKKKKKKDYEMLIRGDSIQVQQINHLVILMTFGLTSPILAVIMALSIIADTFAWQLVIIRFFKYGDPTSPFSRQSDETLKKQQFNQQTPIQEQYGPPNGRLTNVGKIPSPLIVSGRSRENSIEEGEDSSDQGLVNVWDGEEDDDGEGTEDGYDEGDEEERLAALDESIGESWVCLKNNKWVILYCSMCFYAFVLFDMVGDEGGWRHSMAMVIVILLLMFLMRLLLLDIAIVLFQTLLRYTRVPRHSILSSWSVGSIE
jgi:hypothetical protein